MPVVYSADDAPMGAPFSVAHAIALGLIASFIQSLGLTIQRKSHLLNESLPAIRRKTEWRRPLWLVGFAIFLIANVGGTVFQIGALPIVMLAPLGAVSLLYNAVLARFLLNDLLSKYMVIGTALIASGAVLIGYFGVVPSPPHSLDELLDLYARPTFVAFATIFTFLFVGVLTVSHLAEWQLHTRVYRNSLPMRPSKLKHRIGSSSSKGVRGSLRRRWSAPSLAPVAEVSESSSGIATPVLANRDEANRLSALGLSPQQNVVYGRSIVATPIPRINTNIDDLSSAPMSAPARSKTSDTSRNHYGSLGRTELQSSRKRKKSLDVPRLELRESEHRINAETVKQTKLGLAVAYGGASGTLSGACLLLAKSGVELLMLTFSGHNQFGRWQSWLLIGILLAAALLQLWYLNKALKLADPTLVCPLAFCFYNTSSIALGLVYFDQIGALAWYDLVLVAVGTAVLLGGVWTVSLHGNEDACEDDMSASEAERQTLLASPRSAHSRRSSEADVEGMMLANGAGVAGPHLPPVVVSPHSSSFVDHNVAPLTSPEEASLTLHHDQPAAEAAAASPHAHPPPTPPTRRRSSHHQRRPTITLEFPLRNGGGRGLGLFSPSLDWVQSAVDVESSHAYVGAGAGAGAGGAEGGERRMSLYNTIIEHGLSIGISPSSPGFHLQPRSPPLSRVSSNWQPQRGGLRHPPRSMSEADAAPLHDRPLAEQGNDSGFGILPDQSELANRIEAAAKRQARGRWWTRFKQRWRGERTAAAPGELQPLIAEHEPQNEQDEEEEVVVTSNSNGSLMAAPRGG